MSNYKWLSIAVSVGLAEGLSLIAIYGFEEYGIVLFILTPLLVMGMLPVILYGMKEELPLKKAFRLGMNVYLFYVAILLIFAMEGMICIFMYTPIAITLILLGNFIGYHVIKKQKNGNVVIWLIMLSIPITGYVEKDREFPLNVVSTKLEINADANVVWDYLTTFPEFDEPTEFILNTGIAYPLDGKITETPDGKIIDCQFTTGRFIGEINEWEENKLIQFTVKEQPKSMNEFSFWKIDPPHVHDYFNCEKGQFKLTKLSNGNILLEGTTWYRHQIRPNLYWHFWSNYVMDKVHYRVLSYVKENAEKHTKNGKQNV